MMRLLYGAIVVFMSIYAYAMVIALTITGIILFPLLFLIWRISTDWAADRIMRHFIWIYGRTWIGLMLPFIRIKREGFKGSTAGPPCILVVNHFSFFDTYFMALLPFYNVAFTVRSWPFKMLWFAPFMRLADYLDLETIGWEGTDGTGRRILSNGAALLFFPEGHRSKNGEIQRFYSGPFKLAIETGTPIMPLCISGTDRLLPPNRLWFEPATVGFRALPLVDPKDFQGETAHADMRKHVKKLMTENLEEMRKVTN